MKIKSQEGYIVKHIISIKISGNIFLHPEPQKTLRYISFGVLKVYLNIENEKKNGMKALKDIFKYVILMNMHKR
jgi:hypothetical protein